MEKSAQISTFVDPAPLINGRNKASERPEPNTMVGLLAEPQTIKETGLPAEFISGLLLKILYHRGVTEGGAIARSARLKFGGIVEPLLAELKHHNLVEVKGGNHVNPASYRYSITTQGVQRANELLEQNRYVGPCPVTLEHYIRLVKLQSAQRPRIGERQVEQALHELILAPEIKERIGSAVNSFKSLFLYGPPGNGKTSIAKAIGQHLMFQDVMVPYSIYAGGQIIKVFDLETHRRASELGNEQFDPDDIRWVRCRAPVVIVGGELQLRDLDLAYNDTARYYEAPLQLKANGGLFLIDDFGRQQMPPKDLLNRWIVPLEERIDFVTFHTGKKIGIPFETLIVFSTNLPPEDLVDDAFLRRIRHKLGVDYPTVERFYQIFLQVCNRRRIRFNKDAFMHLVKNYYLAPSRPFQACHPRDLMDQLNDFAIYRDEPTVMSTELLDKAAQSYFAKLF